MGHDVKFEKRPLFTIRRSGAICVLKMLQYFLTPFIYSLIYSFLRNKGKLGTISSFDVCSLQIAKIFFNILYVTIVIFKCLKHLI